MNTAVISNANVQAHLVRGAEAIEQFSAMQSLIGNSSDALVIFTSIEEKQTYRLFLIDYFFMQFAALRKQDVALRISLAQELATMLQNPVSSVVEALRPLVSRNFKLPMLADAGVVVGSEGSISILDGTTKLDFTAQSRAAVAAGLVRLANSDTKTDQNFLAQQ